MARNFQQGYYTPKHPEKYIGDLTKIRYMSSWELHLHEFLDNNVNVIKWSSEPFPIPYVKPTDNKVHRYYVDYYIEYKTRAGEIRKELIEVKPKKETRPSKSRNPQTRLYESLTFEINKAKWQAAMLFAKQHGMTFRIITENSLFK